MDPMEIDKFVELSLVHIIRGVRAAQMAERLPGRGGDEAVMVNPNVMPAADMSPKGAHYFTVNRDMVQMIDFDIAVTVSTEKSGQADSGLKIAGIGGFGGKLEQGSSSSEVSRIRFQIPVLFNGNTRI